MSTVPNAPPSIPEGGWAYDGEVNYGNQGYYMGDL